jgi:hypothetical protein
MMVDSVADIQVRKEGAYLSVPAKVGIVLFFIAWYITNDIKDATLILFAHALLHWALA